MLPNARILDLQREEQRGGSGKINHGSTQIRVKSKLFVTPNIENPLPQVLYAETRLQLF